MDFKPLKRLMDDFTAWRIPGNSASVYLHGKEVFRYTSGYENIENSTQMSEGLLFNIYSCSKVTTVAAALSLYEKGYFLLDDPLYSFIPEYKDMLVKESDGSLRKAKTPITLRHLFTMTAGLTYNTRTEAFEKAKELTGGKMDTLDVIKCLAKDPLVFDPGERWNYSLCHDVLAAVVEVIAGIPFSEYVKKTFWEPLGMKDSTYHSDKVLDRVATLYQYVNSTETDLVKLQSEGKNKDSGYVITVDKRPSYVFGENYDSGGAGITTTVEDYALFLSALSRGGLGNNGERILSKSSVELLRTNQLSPAQAISYNWAQVKGYGYGLGVRTMIDRAASGSLGSIGEFAWGGAAGAMAMVDPDRELALFYTHHMLNPQEEYCQPRLRNVLYACLDD